MEANILVIIAGSGKRTTRPERRGCEGKASGLWSSIHGRVQKSLVLVFCHCQKLTLADGTLNNKDTWSPVLVRICSQPLSQDGRSVYLTPNTL